MQKVSKKGWNDFFKEEDKNHAHVQSVGRNEQHVFLMKRKNHELSYLQVQISKFCAKSA